jgi:hypothetical protein
VAQVFRAHRRGGVVQRGQDVLVNGVVGQPGAGGLVLAEGENDLARYLQKPCPKAPKR